MTCPFCDVKTHVKKIVKDFKYCRVIFCNPRLMPGHLLVIPKRHVEKLSELDQKELKELITVLINYQEKLLKISPGCDIKQHYSPYLKEGRLKVRHLHLQLQPRRKNDAYYKHAKLASLYKNITNKEIKDVMKKLK
jgi:diadenosine tetraphosphate (Ap4A) HIT family hydrolase